MTRFKIIGSGPLEITGVFRVTDSKGKIMKTESPLFLCRCGASEKKPYCDGSHKRIGFSE